MAKKQAAIYAPGELSKLRQKLGVSDPKEAKRMAELLGGEVGIERVEEAKSLADRSTRHETVSLGVAGSPPKHHRRIELASEAIRPKLASNRDPAATAVISTATLKIPYRERIKMDRLAAQPNYEIKTSAQAFAAVFSFLKDAPDPINPVFTTKRMNEYYEKLEHLVKTTRYLLPRNNEPRSAGLKQDAPFTFTVIDILRKWNIEALVKELASLQAKPKETNSADYISILKIIFRPIYLMRYLDLNDHITPVFRSLYNWLRSETPESDLAQLKNQIQSALAAFDFVFYRLPLLLHPLLQKFVSNSCLDYPQLLSQQQARLEAFLKVDETELLQAPTPEELLAVSIDSSESETVSQPAADSPSPTAFSRALQESLATMEKLFPEAGWNNLAEFPDLYPYFSSFLDLGRGAELISPRDPLQQIIVLLHILAELFYGLRFVHFTEIASEDSQETSMNEIINRISTNWNHYLEDILAKEYYPRLTEYCRLIDSTPEARTNLYAKRLLDELSWLKRLFFLPFLRFENIGSVRPARQYELTPLFKEIRTLRRILTQVASSIEVAKRRGGTTNIQREQLDNPWAPYTFQVSNPVSERLDAILGGKNSKNCTNAALVFVTLSAVSLLDSLVNDQRSWAYSDTQPHPYRCLDDSGAKPLFGSDEKIDADAIFRKSLRSRQAGRTKHQS